MLKQITLAAILGAAVSSSLTFAQDLIKPKANVGSFKEAEIINFPDGRIVRRVAGSTVALMEVWWPKGAKSVPHNHAIELIVGVTEGRLKVFSGGEEFILEPGGVVTFPAWVDHGFEALEETVTYESAGPGR